MQTNRLCTLFGSFCVALCGCSGGGGGASESGTASTSGATATTGTNTTVTDGGLTTTTMGTSTTVTDSGLATTTTGTGTDPTGTASIGTASGTDTGTGDTGTGGASTGGSSGTGTTGGVVCTPGVPLMPAQDCAALGLTLSAPYDQGYTCSDLGAIPGVPLEYGGLFVDPSDPNRLIVGGNANEASGKLYSVGIARDADCTILGFDGSPTTVWGPAEFNDGGMTFGPGDVLFLARYPSNEIGQLEPGSMVTDKIVDLAPLGVTASPGGLTFVPPGFPSAGALKLASWPSGDWYTLTLAPDNGGTYDVTAAQFETTIPGGPEGFVYIAAGNPQFPTDSILVSEWSDDKLATYEIDGNGDPVVATRKDFMTGLTGAEGAWIDGPSGSFLFSTWDGINRLILVHGFLPQ